MNKTCKNCAYYIFDEKDYPFNMLNCLTCTIDELDGTPSHWVTGEKKKKKIDWDNVKVNEGVSKTCIWKPADAGVSRTIEPKSEKATSAVDHPAHYAEGRKYEPIDVIEDWNLNFALGNAVKYISRAGRKDSSKTIEDLEKSIWYIQKEIEYLKGIDN